MWKIDYHIHTKYSDGASEPGEILKIAAANEMEAVAITDHDGIDGLDEALREGRALGIRVLPGIEFATVADDGTGLHILGYGFDHKNGELNDLLVYIREERDKRNERLVKALMDRGIAISLEELMTGRTNFIGKPVIARALAAKGYVENWEDAFRDENTLANPEIKAIRKLKVDSEVAVKAIIGAGGVPVLAHPIQAKKREEPDDDRFYEKMDGLIGRLREAGLAGLECYHPDQDEKQTLKFIDIAQNHKLKISRGTDFHGEDYRCPKRTSDYIESGNASGYGVYPEDFINVLL
ncbi:MAG: PHP domain-containing protein [Firmicutes bacterium]|nr:PHP domain-containing protein [Bacillota bacterium]